MPNSYLVRAHRIFQGIGVQEFIRWLVLGAMCDSTCIYSDASGASSALEEIAGRFQRD